MISTGIEEKQSAEAQNKRVEKQITFWQGVVKKYTNYRDGYFELSVLEYRLKNFTKSEYYLQKTLYLDPGFKEGLKLQILLDNRRS